MDHNFTIAIIITAIAGLSTTLGSVIALFYKEPGPKYMTFTLGFSAGVMILVSFVELLNAGIASIGFGHAHIAFFLGMGAMYIIDVSISHKYIAEDHCAHEDQDNKDRKLMKTSTLVALGVAIHNFPEGMATFISAFSDVKVGVALGVAIAIHNIPEGIAVSVPVYAATKSRKKAFLWSFLSGVSEPVGALIAGFILLPFLNEAVLGWMLCLVAGFMVYIAFDELLPAAHSYGKEHFSIIGVIFGMIVMAFSLGLFL